MIGPLPEPPHQPGMHLDRGYDSAKTRDLLEVLGYDTHIALKGQPAPIQAGKRWPVERLHAWMNGCGKLRQFTDKRKDIVEFYLNRRADRDPPPDQPSPHALPLAHPVDHPPPPLNIICRTLLDAEDIVGDPRELWLETPVIL